MLKNEWSAVYAKYVIKNIHTFTYVPNEFFNETNGVALKEHAQRFTREQALKFIQKNKGNYVIEDVINDRYTHLSFLAHDIHENAKEHGWWDNERPISELLCLIHSEISEALEAYRNNDDKNLAEKLADIVIRVCDMAEGIGVDIEKEILKKHEINKNRKYRHGNKRC